MKKRKKENHTQLPVEDHHQYLEKTHHSSHKLGIITIVLIFGIFGLWSIFAKLETTITSEGKVITQSYNKIVKHPKGGIVTKIFVKDGDHVKKGDPLLELDSIEHQSTLESNIKKHDKNLLSICRLKVESRFQQVLDCSSYTGKMINTLDFEKLNKDTQTLFYSDRENLQAKIDLLKSQNNILHSQNKGLNEQVISNKRLLLSYQKELEKWNKLLKEDAVDELKAVETQREIEHIILQIGSLNSSIRENMDTIKSNDKQIDLEKASFRNNALIKTDELTLENQQTGNSILALKNTIVNLTLKAPSNGLVIDMKIHASGEVVSAHTPIMEIVPSERDLIIEGYVLPTDIEKIYVGQKAEISFPSFVNPSALPVEGVLTYISADAITPENTKSSFYKVLVKITAEGFKAIKRNNFKIIPGMPSTVFIKTGKKTLAEYLMNPIIQMFKGIYNDN